MKANHVYFKNLQKSYQIDSPPAMRPREKKYNSSHIKHI